MHLGFIFGLSDHPTHNGIEEGNQLWVYEGKYQVLLVYDLLLLHELFRQGQQHEIQYD